MKPFLASVGISYRSCDPTLLDSVIWRSGRETEWPGLQHLVLSTCNRREVFFIANGEEDVLKMRRLYLEGPGRSVPADMLEKALVVRTGETALVYLCRIASGLESMVLGEYQILGQVKAAYAEALEAGCVGKELDRIVRDAITCAKRVKTELDIGAVPPSVCRVGMELVDRRFGVSGKQVFVIGSGRTGTLAAKLARRLGARAIAVCNRSPERTLKLIQEVGAQSVEYSARYAMIAESDIVISATSSPHVVVCADMLKLSHPVVFLDLASPRDVESAVGELPFATRVGIDTIGELASGDRDERERLTAQGVEIVREAVRSTILWMESLS